MAARIEDRHALAKRALGYVELYGAYTETDARYRVDRLLELWDTFDDEDHETFCFDPGVIDWDHYVHHVHLPSVIEHTRVRAVLVDPNQMRTRMRAEAFPGEDPDTLPHPSEIGPMIVELAAQADLGLPKQTVKFSAWKAAASQAARA